MAVSVIPVSVVQDGEPQVAKGVFLMDVALFGGSEENVQNALKNICQDGSSLF